MKKLLVIPCLILIALGLSSFVYYKYNNKEHVSAPRAIEYSYWFKYIGPYPGTYTTATNPANYVLMTPAEQDYFCEGSNALCAITAYRVWNGFEWKPNFTDTSFGNITSRLQNYYFYGLVGGGIREKE